MKSLSEELTQIVEQGAAAVLATVIEAEGNDRVVAGAKCLVRDGEVRAETIGDADIVEAARHAAASATEAKPFARRRRGLALFVAVVRGPSSTSHLRNPRSDSINSSSCCNISALVPLSLRSDKTNSPDCVRCAETMTCDSSYPR